MTKRAFTVVLTPDVEDGGYTVTVPRLPGAITHGDTADEALVMARDAIEVYLKDEAALVAGLAESAVEVIIATVTVDLPQ